MWKTCIAGLTALSLTLTSATPAQAQGIDQDEIGKILFGLVALTAISKAIGNARNDDDDDDVSVTRNGRRFSEPPVTGRWIAEPPVTAPRIAPRHTPGNRPGAVPSRGQWKQVPQSCLRRVETRFGIQRMFGRRCLDRNYRHLARLPERCAVRVYTAEGPRRGYDPLCLREQGFNGRRDR